MDNVAGVGLGVLVPLFVPFRNLLSGQHYPEKVQKRAGIRAFSAIAGRRFNISGASRRTTRWNEPTMRATLACRERAVSLFSRRASYWARG